VRVVLADGCFDPLHPGHVAYLEEARTFGDYLVVALTLDEHVNKGPKRPYLRYEERRAMLAALRCVGEVRPSESGWDSVLRYRPHVFAKGEDWNGRLPVKTIEACAEVGAEIRFTRAPRFGVEELVRRIMR
jgi:cytidyltransferase-like protein